MRTAQLIIFTAWIWHLSMFCWNNTEFFFKRELTKVKSVHEIVYTDTVSHFLIFLLLYYWNKVVCNWWEAYSKLVYLVVSPGKLKRFLTAIFMSNHSRMLFATKHFSPTHGLFPWLFWVGDFCHCWQLLYFILCPLLSQRQGKCCSSIRKQVMFAVFDLLPAKSVSPISPYCSYLKKLPHEICTQFEQMMKVEASAKWVH